MIAFSIVSLMDTGISPLPWIVSGQSLNLNSIIVFLAASDCGLTCGQVGSDDDGYAVRLKFKDFVRYLSF